MCIRVHGLLFNQWRFQQHSHLFSPVGNPPTSLLANRQTNRHPNRRDSHRCSRLRSLVDCRPISLLVSRVDVQRTSLHKTQEFHRRLSLLFLRLRYPLVVRQRSRRNSRRSGRHCNRSHSPLASRPDSRAGCRANSQTRNQRCARRLNLLIFHLSSHLQCRHRSRHHSHFATQVFNPLVTQQLLHPNSLRRTRLCNRLVNRRCSHQCSRLHCQLANHRFNHIEVQRVNHLDSRADSRQCNQADSRQCNRADSLRDNHRLNPPRCQHYQGKL